MTKKLTDSELQAQQTSPKKPKWVGSFRNTSDVGYDPEWYDNETENKDK